MLGLSLLWLAVQNTVGGEGAPPPPPPPPPPPAPAAGVPDSPMMLETSGSLVGQATLLFIKGRWLQGWTNDPITDDPITGTTVYLSSSWAAAEAGTYTYSASAGTTETATFGTVAAGTWYAWAVSVNSSGPSDHSHILELEVT